MVRSFALVIGVLGLIVVSFVVAGLIFDDPAVFVLRRFADLIDWLKFWN
ncbi:MAG: hypothetical protein AAFQ79_13525 [Pseudomonadota bacterium]